MAEAKTNKPAKADQGHQPQGEGRSNNTPDAMSEEEAKYKEKKSHPEDLKGPLHDEGKRTGTDPAQ
jgi:hypothetical protein